MELPSSPQIISGSNCGVAPPTLFWCDKLTNRMIKSSAVKPPDRCAQIVKWRQELAYEQQDKIRQWGLQVSWLSFYGAPKLMVRSTRT